MSAAKGFRPPNAGKGRPKGSRNKDTALIRDMIAQALHEVGGVEYLARCAESHPGPFLGLIGKVMPVQLEGAGGGAIRIEWPIAPPKLERC